MTNRTDPICGMSGVIERHGHWFCSERCAAEFERRGCPVPSQPAGRRAGGVRYLRDPWIWAPLTGLIIGTAGWWSSGISQAVGWWPDLAPSSAIYVDYVKKVAIFFLLGLVLGGIVDHFVPKAYIIKLLSGSRKRVILRSTLLGFLASACSHGCLALSMELYRKGASVPAVISFLLASPWASLSLTLILIGLFGVHGLVIVGCALVVALTTGLIFQRLDRRGLIDTNPNTQPIEEGFSIRRDFAARWQAYPWTTQQLATDAQGIVSGMIPLGRMTLGWFQLGLVLGALVGGFVSPDIFQRFLGPTAGGLMLTIVIATVVEVCSEGTAPIAFELYRQTGALGNAFAFLMGGVVTDYTELGAVWANIGRRTVKWMLIVTLPLVIGIGLLLNLWSRYT